MHIEWWPGEKNDNGNVGEKGGGCKVDNTINVALLLVLTNRRVPTSIVTSSALVQMPSSCTLL